MGRHQQAVDYFQKAIRLNRNNADGYAMLGSALNISGRPDDGMVAVQTAMRLNPHHHGWYDMHLGRGQFALGAFAQARRTLANVPKAKPEYPVVRVNLAATLAVMGRQDEARAEVAKLLELNAGYSLGNVAKSLPYKDHVIRDRFLNALRLAELPD